MFRNVRDTTILLSERVSLIDIFLLNKQTDGKKKIYVQILIMIHKNESVYKTTLTETQDS
jgi:hypothetical protein